MRKNILSTATWTTLTLALALAAPGCEDNANVTDEGDDATTPVVTAQPPADDAAAAPPTIAPAPADASAEASADAPKLTADTAGAKPYPLDVCIVSDEKLGEMGEPIVMAYNGQTVKFCCSHCKPDFEADPQKYLSKLTTASAAAEGEDAHAGHNH